MTLKLLVIGASGLLGSKIVEVATKEGYEVYATYLSTPISLDGNAFKVDITDNEAVTKLFSIVKPDTVIHCAALTDVDKCEVAKELALKVNAYGAAYVAKACEKVGAHIVYISTDYVFDGEKGLYKENDKTNPINFYGYTKLMGENFVSSMCSRYTVVRTSVIYGARPASGKTNFALWLIEKLSRKQEVNLLEDQYVSPTLNTNLAYMLLEVCKRELLGVYHLAGASRISRLDFAYKLAEVFNFDKSFIHSVKMNQLKWVAKRPRDSSLDVSKALKELKEKPLAIEDALKILKGELKTC